MTNKQNTYTLMKLFAEQLMCDANDFLLQENKVVINNNTSKQFFKMCCFGDSAIACTDIKMYDWCSSFLSNQEGFRCFDGIQMIEISKKLQEHGYSISCGQGMLPDLTATRVYREIKYDIKHFNKQEILALSNEAIFNNIKKISSIHSETEHLFVAFDKERVIGVVRADKISENINELSVEVIPEYRRGGIATNMITIATNELLKNNVIPYVITAWSNIRSRGVLQKCGYYPACVVMDSMELEWANEILQRRND